MEVVAIKGQARTGKGKSQAKTIRKEGLVPGVMYSSEGNTHFSVEPFDLKPLIYTPAFKLAELELDGNKTKCILKDVQFHPVTDEVLHVDFMVVEPGRTIKVEVPVAYTGVAPGVKTGGKLVKKLRKVKIKAQAENLVDSMTLDISSLQLGQSIRVRDIQPKEGIEIMNASGIPVASVEIPRALKSAEAAAAKAGTAAAPAAAAEATEE
jgi:large subunit ribosomal protein L25